MVTEVLVPPLGQTVDSITLVAWHKDEGETVARGEMLFAVETDKAVLDIEAPASGVLRGVIAQPGDEVDVLSAIALIAQPGEVAEHRPPEQGQGGAASSTAWRRPGIQPQTAAGRTFISPRARRLAEEHGISLMTLRPTGPEGAIVERDVRAYVDAQAEPKTPFEAQDAGLDRRIRSGTGPSEPIPRSDIDGVPDKGELSGVEVLETIPLRTERAVIARRMAQGPDATAQVTLNSEADATALVELRCQLAKHGVDASYNALLLRILGRALRDHPRLNASLVGDTIQVWRRVHIGLAVDSDRGLLVPVVRDVDRKGLAQLEDEFRFLVERARIGKSSPEELTGGTFTLTNLDKLGIDSFTPIINLPKCAVLGVGRIKEQPVVHGNPIVARHAMWLSLSFDHRLVHGALAARFMQRVVQLIERPYLLLT